jgi:hypothetical protein
MVAEGALIRQLAATNPLTTIGNPPGRSLPSRPTGGGYGQQRWTARIIRTRSIRFSLARRHDQGRWILSTS